MSIHKKIRMALILFTAFTIIVLMGVCLYELSVMRSSVSELSSEHTALIQERSDSDVVDEIARNADNAIQERLDGLLSNTLILVPAVVCMLLLASVLVSQSVSNSITHPLKRLAEAAQRVGEGDFSCEIEESGDAETASLARSFNGMTRALRHSMDMAVSEEESRHRAEESLEFSRRQFQYVIDLIPGGVFRYSVPDGQIDFVSSNMLRLLGYSEEEFRSIFGNDVHTLVYEEDRSRINNIVNDRRAASDFHECEYRIQTRSEGVKWFSDIGHRTVDEDGREWCYVVITDINERKWSEYTKEGQLIKLESIASLDGVSGILNRATVEKRIRDMIDTVPERGLLLMYDLDDFKSVNDTYGHIDGDLLLKGVAGVLKKTFRSTDIAGRWGGDEFIVYMNGARPSDIVLGRLQRTLMDIASIGDRYGWTVPTTISLGVADVSVLGANFQTLYAAADKALYAAKSRGKGRFVIYDESMEQSNEESPL